MKWQKIRIRHCFHLHILDYNLYGVISCLISCLIRAHCAMRYIYIEDVLNAVNGVTMTRERENAEKKWKDAAENGWVERPFVVNYP